MNNGDNASGEVLRTLGLMLNLSAIVAFALFLSTLSPSGSGPSALAAGITIVAFLASLLCFAIDRHRTEEENSRPAHGPVTIAAEV
ncbi:hypothetical protein [Mycobacterium sp. EPa45]|uniref:hypothetical protein n=1 Tax=Mycobacterium sp. EPa45 TaxID=1545728 RepID=UPI0006427A52|nr:hypothetical protein [Mycobacterium sp. EPa45]AKK25774.1 hypothetical protein AB431_02560 [Mycobacterium sp. EPa45]